MASLQLQSASLMSATPLTCHYRLSQVEKQCTGIKLMTNIWTLLPTAYLAASLRQHIAAPKKFPSLQFDLVRKVLAEAIAITRN